MGKKWMIPILLLFIVISGSAFPIYNFGKNYTQALTGVLLYLNIACYLELGFFEKNILKITKVSHVVIINLGIILLGMFCRYLLEWGEVSNIYNFTIQNIILHIIVTFIISMISYLVTKKKF